jgi:hypothetical protein
MKPSKNCVHGLLTPLLIYSENNVLEVERTTQDIDDFTPGNP